jgi:hypothetical protein
LNTDYKKLIATTLLLTSAAGLYPHPAAADGCAPIVQAELATIAAPGFRQYMSPATASAGKNERLLSIALDDTVYIAMGGQSGWQKMDRKEIIATAKEAADDAEYRDCKPLGSESVGGVTAAVYQFTMESKSKSFPASHAKIWIGADGLVRKQATDKGSLRYEYENVKAPVP